MNLHEIMQVEIRAAKLKSKLIRPQESSHSESPFLIKGSLETEAVLFQKQVQLPFFHLLIIWLLVPRIMKWHFKSIWILLLLHHFHPGFISCFQLGVLVENFWDFRCGQEHEWMKEPIWKPSSGANKTQELKAKKNLPLCVCVCAYI